MFGPDFMIYVYAKTKNLTWAYHCHHLNCHHVSSFLKSGIIGSNSDDKTFFQGVSEKISLGCVDNKNKLVAHISPKEMIVLLNNPEVGKRRRV